MTAASRALRRETVHTAINANSSAVIKREARGNLQCKPETNSIEATLCYLELPLLRTKELPAL